MKQHGNNEYIFKGWDWTEIAEYFNIDESDEKSAEEIESKFLVISEEIHGVCLGAHPDIKKLREFVLACHKADTTYKKPMWKGLSAIKEDSAFLKFMNLLYREMWN